MVVETDEKPCNKCGQMIKLRKSERTGNWYPVNLDGSLHNCTGPRVNNATSTRASPPMASTSVGIGSKVENEQLLSVLREIRDKIAEQTIVLNQSMVNLMANVEKLLNRNNSIQ
ncbi:MAG: hypothetical protein ACTSYS_14060 [Promethearchaeota archaeon]